MKTGRKSRQHLRWDRAVANETARPRLPISCIRSDLSICEMMTITSEANYPSGPGSSVQYSSRGFLNARGWQICFDRHAVSSATKRAKLGRQASAEGQAFAALQVGAGKTHRGTEILAVSLLPEGTFRHSLTAVLS